MSGPDVGAAMMDVADVWRQVLEVAEGQRQAALGLGYTDEVAMVMALQVHQAMSALIGAQMLAQVTPAEAVTPPA